MLVSRLPRLPDCLGLTACESYARPNPSIHPHGFPLPPVRPQIVLGGDGSLLHSSVAGTPGPSADDDDAPTVPVAHPPALPPAPRPGSHIAEDADATRPLTRATAAGGSGSRPASPPPARAAGPRVHIDGSGNVNVTRAGAASVRPLPVPPPPPPALAETRSVPALPAARMPMGPPPPKPARTAPAVPPAAQQQQAARPGRRVVEDENSVTVKAGFGERSV